ncbi:MAG: adenine nucleotide alpha hydrolase [Phyllobacteriaceae bacterium]|nr:adenine nucleotide alpha hydrolase [Phyllobacteriaceae bacterium]
MSKPRLILSWSSGKDCAFALHALRREGRYDVVGLATTFNSAFDRVAMHAVRRELVEAQAAATGLPLWRIDLPWPCSNEDYERIMTGFVAEARAAGVTAMAFGDLFLEDVRAYREKNLAGTGMEPVFPLWGRDTSLLAREMIAAGLEARVTCVDPRQLDPSFAGRAFDAAFLDDLPGGVDPCGERGEFHSFCHAGPMFDRPLAIRLGHTVTRDGFVFTDLLAADVER